MDDVFFFFSNLLNFARSLLNKLLTDGLKTAGMSLEHIKKKTNMIEVTLSKLQLMFLIIQSTKWIISAWISTSPSWYIKSPSLVSLNIKKLLRRQRIPLSSRLLSFVVPLARECAGDCVTETEGVLLLRLCSCPVWRWPALFSPPDLFLSPCFLPSGLVLWFNTAALKQKKVIH